MSSPHVALRRSILIFGFLISLLVSTQPAVTAEHSAVMPAPRTGQSWQDRAALLNQRIKDTPGARLLFIGDSITQGWEQSGKEVWSRYYGDRDAVNLGIGGDRTQHVLWRLENGNLAGVAPRVAVVMIGTNNSNGEDNTPAEIADGVSAIVDRLRRSLPETRILLLAIFPRGENFNPQRGKITQVNQVLQKLDDGEHIHFLDIGHRFLTREGRLPADIMPDFLHLSPAGYAIWAAAIEPTLARLLDESPKAAGEPTPDVGGKWNYTMTSPQGEVTLPLELTAEGHRLTGRFGRGESGWLTIEDGRIDGPSMTFKLRRDRPGGGEMVYRMTARLVDGQIKGTAEADLDGNPVTVDWVARRP